MLQLQGSNDVVDIGGSPAGEAAKPEANSQDRATLKVRHAAAETFGLSLSLASGSNR